MIDESYYLPDFYDVVSTGIPGDIEFYLEEAQQVGTPVLEVACGTGRVLIPMAEAGVPVVGMDISHTMLARARHKLGEVEANIRQRVELVEADMRDFSLGRQFGLILIPYRAFQHLLTAEDQRRALLVIHRHLAPGGRLIINLFDPKLASVVERSQATGTAPRFQEEFTHPKSGNRVLLWASGRVDLVDQRLYELWIYEEINDQGRCLQRQTRSLELRWTYRYEMQHLLELCGYRIVSLYGDFDRGSYRHGGEQIWVVEREERGQEEHDGTGSGISPIPNP